MTELLKRHPSPLFQYVSAGFALLAILVGCASLSATPTPTSPQAQLLAKLAVQAATVDLIRKNTRNPEEATARAREVKQVATEARTFFDRSPTSLADLPKALNDRVASLNLSPEDRLLANNLIQLASLELTALTQPSATQQTNLPVPLSVVKATVNTLLDWVIEATAAYGA